jgi:SdrD B-like domain
VYILSFEPTLDAEEFGVGKGKLSVASTRVRPFSFGPGVEKTQDMGYIALGGDVRGSIFLDKDASGARFGREPGIPGVQVILEQADREIVGEDTTDRRGDFLIPNIQPGPYTL